MMIDKKHPNHTDDTRKLPDWTLVASVLIFMVVMSQAGKIWVESLTDSPVLANGPVPVEKQIATTLYIWPVVGAVSMVGAVIVFSLSTVTLLFQKTSQQRKIYAFIGLFLGLSILCLCLTSPMVSEKHG